MNEARKCTAPTCGRDAVMQVKGQDYDGTWFIETTCESCGEYLIGAGAECGFPVVHWRLDPSTDVASGVSAAAERRADGSHGGPLGRHSE